MAQQPQQFDLLIDRRNTARTQWVERAPANKIALSDGQIVVEIDDLAFTANNITYLLFGDLIGYWRLFPAPESGMGLLPAMGTAHVVRSQHPDIHVGERLWGFFPIATHLLMTPGHVTKDRFEDLHEHRAAMYEKEPNMRPYQRYYRIPAMADFITEHEGIQSALRGQFTTSFLMDWYLKDKEFFGARQVLLTSASSRTAIAGAWLSSHHDSIRVIGLTSQRNRQFTEQLGCYHEVRTYEEISQLVATVPTAIVDIAGDGDLMRQVHKHYGDNIKYSGSLGKAHPKSPMTARNLPGATPRMFFAPTHMEKRIAQWGVHGFDERLNRQWKTYEAKAAGWFKEVRAEGAEAISETYGKALQSGFDPALINILSP